MGYFKMTKTAATFGMGLAFGNAFAVELRHLFDEVVVVQHDRAVWANR
jgi:hypothetical protein